MNGLLKLSRAIDRVTDGLGRWVAWLILIMTLVGAYNAAVRYLGRFIGVNLSSNVYLELQWYLFSLIFLLAAGYTLRHDGHVRVDVIYARLSSRARAWIDIVGTLVLLVPFSLFVLRTSWPSVRASWVVQEGSPDPGGLPRYPLKSVILICFLLLLVQAVSELIKHVDRLRRPAAAEAERREDDLHRGGL
jgi:TRAP-type mannitol/chloroaromatic compound transport system permease small subunit